MTHFADRLVAAIQKKNAPVCVGLDPLIERLPGPVREAHKEEPWTALLLYGREVIRAVAAHVPAIKINIAFFEPYQAEGIRVYHELVAHAKAAGLIVIGDVKRADIGHSSTQYAVAHLGDGGFALPDAVTVNPYLGTTRSNRSWISRGSRAGDYSCSCRRAMSRRRKCKA